MRNALLILALCSLTSCKTFLTEAAGVPQPAAEFTKASRLFLDLVGPEYQDYLSSDESLSELQRLNRLAAVDDFEFAVRQAEKAQDN